jgi:PTS system nitrogen regulatory IIA component
MDIFSIVQEEACTPSLKSKTKESCLEEISRLAALVIPGNREEEILGGLTERETKGSTAFGEGIAIPHTRLKDIDSFVLSIGLSRRGIDYESLDRKKTRIFFTIVGPDDRQDEYLKLLAQVSRIAKNEHARQELLGARTPEAIKEAFLRFASPGRAIAPKGKLPHKLLILTVHELKYFDDIIEILVGAGINELSVLESAGPATVLSSVPLFSEFLNFTGSPSGTTKTVLAVIEEKTIPSLVEDIEGVLGDLDTHSGAHLMVMDIAFMKGSLEVL